MSRVMAMCVWLVLSIPAFADEPSADYKALVDRLLSATNALSMGRQISDLMVNQSIAMLQASGRSLSEETIAGVKSELTQILDRSIKAGEFNRLIYPIYFEHISQPDLAAAVDFHESPAGQRMAAAGPVITQQSIQAGQVWGASLEAEIIERLGKLLDEETPHNHEH